MIKLYRLIKPFSLALAAVVGLVFMQTLAELYLPSLMARIVDQGIAHGDMAFIWRTGVIMLLIAAGGTCCSILVSLLAARTSVGFARLLRSRVFARVESFSLQEFDALGTATLITRTTNDITQVQTVTFMIQRLMISAPIMCIGGILMAIKEDAALARVYFICIPLLALVIAGVLGRAIPMFRQMQVKLDRINLVMRENLTGIRVIRAFNRTGTEIQRFDGASLDLMDNAIRVNKLVAMLMPSMILIMNFTIIAVVWLGSLRIDQGDMQVGALMAFIQYAMLIMISLIIFSMIFIMIPRAAASATRINEVLETQPHIVDAELPGQPGDDRGLLQFRHVSFSYPGAEQPALNNISFQARPGETTAIIGGTGSGKSTLVNLIMRFYDVDQGQILLDGVDIRTLSQSDLRARFGYVPQRNQLFTGTVASNIHYGRPEANEAALRQAAETAQAMEFIDALPEGLDSPIEQGGANLSGGQKQRLSIARALVRRPAVYIFDDSFSALDFKTDARLRAALRKETATATVIIIAQRISTVMDADQIIVLDEGHLIARGTHRDLMNSCQVYREIVLSQLSEEELA